MSKKRPVNYATLLSADEQDTWAERVEILYADGIQRPESLAYQQILLSRLGGLLGRVDKTLDEKDQEEMF